MSRLFWKYFFNDRIGRKGYVNQFLYRLNSGSPARIRPSWRWASAVQKASALSDGVLDLDFGGFADEGIIHRKKINRELV